MRVSYFAYGRALALALLVSTTITYGYAQAAGAAAPATHFIMPDGPGAHAAVAPLTATQHQLLHDRLLALRHQVANLKPAVSAGPQAAMLTAGAPETSVAPLSAATAALPAPGALVIGRNKAYPIIGDGRSDTAEPSLANSGNHYWMTMNWNRGFSNDGGSTWTAQADDSGPADAPFFCCDQDVVHDHGRDVTLWSNLYVNSNLTTGAIRIFVRQNGNLADKCSYTFDPGPGTLLDYPHLALGNNFLYLTTNNIVNGGWAGAEIWRFPLDAMYQCQGFNYNFFTWTGSVGQVVWTPTRGATDTMYMVTIENASQLRYFHWAENSNTIFWTAPVNVNASNFGQATCIGGLSGNNWMADPLSTSAIGFQVRTTVAQDHGTQYLATYYTVAAGGSFNHPQAYAAGVIARTSDFAILKTPDIWNSSSCFGFPDVTSNARGDIGLTIAFGSSSSGGGPAQGYVSISDDFTNSGSSGFFGTVFLVASADDNSSRYGDYLTIRQQEPVDLAFIATSYTLLGGGVNVRAVEFVRGRYDKGYLDRRAK